ncbi:MAG TPA: glycosyltransferase family 39 protein [Baekduia sp.]|nr:glycosyltransferase family 39 protein [Baekduia sp.]
MADGLDAIAASGTAVVALIVAITLVRLLGAAGAIDPLAGPDTGSYVAAARGLADQGLLADHVPNLPYWPAGYPAFLAAIFAVVGDAPRAVAALQVLLLGVATWSLFGLVRREIGGAVAVVAVVLTGLSPALLAASDELMYETVLASALVIAFDLVSRARRAPGRRGVALAAAGASVLGLASTMQPKALAVVAVLLAWACLGPRGAGGARTAWLALAVVVAAAVGPVALMARTAAATDHAALSANLGATARIGLNDGAGGGYRYDVAVLRGCGLPPRLVSRDRVGFSDDDLFTFDRTLTRCSASWAASHPLRALRLAAVKALYFWSPMVGPLPRDREASWAQPFDVRRAVPSAVRDAGAFATVNRVLGNLWTLLVVGLVVAGAAVGVRSEHRRATLLLAAPVALFLAVSMVTIGDARFRLPVTPFYIVLQALALVAVLHRLAGRTGQAAPQAP